MPGLDERTGSLFSYVDLEARGRRDHPLRMIREVADATLMKMDADFAVLYRPGLGRPSVAPERFLRATARHRSNELSRKLATYRCRRDHCHRHGCDGCRCERVQIGSLFCCMGRLDTAAERNRRKSSSRTHLAAG